MTQDDDLRPEAKTDDPEAPETSTGDGQEDETSTMERTHMSFAEALREAESEDEETPADPKPEKEPEPEVSHAPDTPETFEQYLMTVAVRAPELDGASEAMATDVVREKGFHHVKAWRLPDGSILITKG